MTAPDDATIERYITDLETMQQNARRAMIDGQIAGRLPNYESEIAPLRELLALRKIVREVAAEEPVEDEFGVSTCIYCSRTEYDGSVTHTPACPYRQAVEWASQHEEATP